MTTAIVACGATATISGVTITGMDASNTGALYVSASELTLDGVAVVDNSASGIYVLAGSNLSVFNSTIANNTGDGIHSVSNAAIRSS